MTSLRSALISCLLIPAAAPFAAGQEPAAQPAEMQTLLACRTIAELAERAACFDTATTALADALDSGELALVERRAVREVERDGFGLSLPTLGGLRQVFRQPAQDQSSADAAPEPETLADGTQVEYARDGDMTRLSNVPVAAVRDTGRGIIVTLENGQVWRQTDATRTFPVRDRHWEQGVTAEIERGALGSFWMTLSHDNRRMRAQRVQ